MADIPVLIGLHGRKQSGKDSAFQLMKEWAGARFLTAGSRGFADKMKLSAARLFFPDCDLDFAIQWCDHLKIENIQNGVEATWYDKRAQAFNEKRISGRQFLQHIGTEAHRDVFGDNFWVDQLLPLDGQRLGWAWNFSVPVGEQIEECPDYAVITDVRFKNEAERIRELGGKVVIIDADERLGPLPADAHPSELPLPSELIDYKLDNNGSIEELREQIVKNMNYLEMRRCTHSS